MGDYELLLRHYSDFTDAPSLLFNDDLGANPLLEQADVGNNADGFVVLAEAFQGGNGDFEGLGIETAKALVDEKRVDPHGPACQIRETERQCQASEEAFAS